MALPGVNPTVQYLDNNLGNDGTILGQTATTAKVGFFAATPVVQPTNANQAAVVTTAPTSGGTSFAYTSAQAISILTLLNQIRADLVTLGLLKGS